MRTAGVVVALLSSVAFAAPARPKVNVGIPKLTGASDPKAVGTTLRGAGNKFADCYSKALKANPELKTTATVTFTISGDGHAVAASATGLDQNAESCIAGIVGTLAFAKPKDGATSDVNVTIAFELPKASDTDDKVDGGFGYGTTGLGPAGGCGGSGWGTIGTGTYGTIGHGSGYGVGGCGGGGMRGRTSAVPMISIGQPTVTGDLDKAIIRRYIKRNIQKLQYCYEKQLLAKPKIQGTLKAEFTIAGTGLVTTSTAKGVDKDVEACVGAVIKAIEFPKPKNGSDVKVAYPFTLKPSGG